MGGGGGGMGAGEGGIYRLAFIRVQEPAATDYENQCMIPLTE